MNITNIALSGMNAAQAGMSAAAMNLANANTPGYNRQRIEQSALGAMGNNAGHGVNVDAFVRMSEYYLVSEEWKQTSNHTYFTASQNYLTKLEHAVGNEDTGLATGLRAFFNSLTSATADPASSAYREQLLNDANAMALGFNNFNESVKDQKQMIATQRKAMVNQVNGLLRSIDEYNQKIVNLSGNTNISALQDSRDEQVKKLSEQLDIRVTQAADGGYSISMKDGSPLINGQSVGEIQINTQSAQPKIELNFAGNNIAINMSCGAGLGSINDYESGVLAKMQDAVMKTAEQLANEINTQLGSGFDLNGNSGKELFTFDMNNPAGMLTVNDIKPNELAFSGTAGAAGDASNLHHVLALKDKKFTLPGIGEIRLGEAGSALVGVAAFAGSNNQQSIKQTKNMLDIAIFNRDSLSGVNSDQEGGDILEYSKAYRANMKVISTGEQLFSELLALFR